MSTETPTVEEQLTSSFVATNPEQQAAIDNALAQIPQPPTPEAGLTIDASTLNQPQLDVPTQPVAQAPAPVPSQAQSGLDGFEFDESLTPAQQAQEQLLQQLFSGVEQLSGESAFQTQAEQAVGLQGLKQTLQGLNNQIITLNQELNADDVSLIAGLQQIEDKPIAMGFITGQQASVQRQANIARGFKVAEIGMLNAQALVAQGNVALAQQTADKAVKAKYDPIREAMGIAQAQLNILEPILSRDEKRQAEKRQLSIDLALRDLDKREAEEKDVFSIATNASGNGAPASLVNEIANAESREEALVIAGGFNVSIADRITQRKYSDSVREAAKTSGADGSLDSISEIDTWLKPIGKINELGFKSAVGTSKLRLRIGRNTKIKGVRGARQEFLGTIEQLVSGLSLDALLEAKANGATFGSLSNEELETLAKSATKIGTWKELDKNGKVLGYNISETAFNREMEKIKNFYIKDFERKTGVQYQEPQAINSEEDYLNALFSNQSPFSVLGN